MTATSSGAVTAAGTDITVRRAAGRIGAEIGGVLLSGDIDDGLLARIREEILTNKVVFFRGQQHLDEAGQAAFAARLGPLTTAHPTVPGLEGNNLVLDLDSARGGRANNWHTDVTFVDRPPAFSVLRSVRIPAYGGDTVWANTAAAYTDLPGELRDLADQLWALHTNAFDYARLPVDRYGTTDPARAAYAEVFTSIEYETLHPVVRVHPETGERSLLLGGFARQIAGLSGTESAALIGLLQERITRLENTVRWSWREGDVVIWDNRATQHYAIADYGDQARIVRRITVTGDVPVGVDGRHSISRKGDSSHYTFAAAS